MVERKTTIEEIGKKATYTAAVPLPGGAQPADASEALHQRTVATSLTHGTVTLRYAPRTPKAAGPINTAS